MRYYIAYGSNLNARQMQLRCPGAKALGTATLKGWRLNFRGSKTGSYLTIEPYASDIVPVVIWRITEEDERRLDVYEGYPKFYYKKEMRVQYKGLHTGKYRTVDAFVYIMSEGRPIQNPKRNYLLTCMVGYMEFNLQPDIMMNALKRARATLQE